MGQVSWSLHPTEKLRVATATRKRTIGPADQGRRLTLAQFVRAEFEEGSLYELARGIVVVTDVPGIPHGRTVNRVARLFFRYDEQHPGRINYQAGGGECRLRLIGMQSDRHPDQAIYLDDPPTGKDPWSRWVPQIVVEIVSVGSEDRDYVEKREEYLRAGVREYWILDANLKRLLVLKRAGDVWEEVVVPAGKSYRTRLLPGLVVEPAVLMGLAGKA